MESEFGLTPPTQGTSLRDLYRLPLPVIDSQSVHMYISIHIMCKIHKY